MIRLLILALGLLASAGASAQSPRFIVPDPPAVDAKAVVVVDMANGDVLYENNADVVIPPASLTKIMTMMVALDAVDHGVLSLDTRVEIAREDVNLPYRSSLMYLREGMSVPFDTLLRGMAVVSGNDAAMAVARTIAGSMDGFVQRMNVQARKLGLKDTHFVEPSGLSELNSTTAREMAVLARTYLQRYPEALEKYHSRTSMEFPTTDVLPAGQSLPAERVVLRATNSLLFRYEACDGLKTGYIDESGYNLVATAQKDGTRVISVTLGGTEGTRSRERSGAALLDWSFETWKTISVPVDTLPSVRIWGGEPGTIQLAMATLPVFTVPSAIAGVSSYRLEAPPYLEAPISAGDVVGRVVFTSGDHIVRRIDLVAASEARLGGLLVRFKDAIIRFFVKLLG